MPPWQARLARGVHLLLYVCLFVQPVTGYLGSAYSGYPVKFFGLTLPGWAAADPAIKDAMSVIHRGNSWVLVSALGLHLAGSLKHRRNRPRWVVSPHLAVVAAGARITPSSRVAISVVQSHTAASSSLAVAGKFSSRAMSCALLPRSSLSSARAPAASRARTVSSWP